MAARSAGEGGGDQDQNCARFDVSPLPLSRVERLSDLSYATRIEGMRKSGLAGRIGGFCLG